MSWQHERPTAILSLTEVIREAVNAVIEQNRATLESTGFQLSSLTLVVQMNTKQGDIRDIVFRPEGRITPRA